MRGATAIGFLGLLACVFFLVGVGNALAAAPTVTIDGHPTANYASAEVSGTVDPGSQEATVYAEVRPVGTETWRESRIQSIPANAGPTPVSGTIGSLRAGVEYEARLDAQVFQPQFENYRSPPPNPKFTTKPVTPATVTIEAPTAITATSAHFAGQINPNSPEPEPASPPIEEAYATFWRFECKPECSAQGGTVAADNSPHPVTSDANLRPGNRYEVRLVGENAGGPFYSEYQVLTTPAVAPELGKGLVDNITASTATFIVFVNPGGGRSKVSFQYVTAQQFAASGFAEASETPPVSVGTGNNQLRGASEVTGLSPATSYYFRPIVTNSVERVVGEARPFATFGSPEGPETGSCPNEAFRSGLGAFLPECRAYELASPIDKGDVGIEGLLDVFNSSLDGSSVTFYSQAFTGLTAGGGGHQQFSSLLATRDGETWSTQRLSVPEQLGELSEFLGTTANQQYAFVEAGNQQYAYPEATDPYPRGAGLYSINTKNGVIETVVPPSLHPNEVGQEEFSLDGTSLDGSQVFFETRAHILPEATPGAVNLYLWRRETGELSVVGRLPGSPGEVSPTGSFGGAFEWFGGFYPEGGGASAGNYVEAIHAISADGSQIFFTAAETGQIYLRSGLRGGSPTTTRVSAPVEGASDPEGPKPAAFQEATPDGARAFFLSAEKLTPRSTTGPSDEGKDLYRWERGGTLVDVTPDGADPNGAEVLGLLGISSDGESGYFVARGKLADGGTSGAHNLYRFESRGPGAGFAITYVASLTSSTFYGDALNWSPRSYEGRAPIGSASRTSRVTPSGDILLFASEELQPGYPNVEGRQLYRYDARYKQLLCVSCSPTGARPKGPPELSSEFLNAYFRPGSVPLTHITRNLSPDGNSIFFQSPDALVPRDTNSQQSCTYYNTAGGGETGTGADCEDVYEWVAPGSSASCPEARVDGGCIFLLSPGTGSQPSQLIDESADGSSVFIASSSQLVTVDRDSLYDVYDLRVDGGLASQQTVPASPCDSGESCRGSFETAPPSGGRGSGSFHGPGNAKSAPRHQKKRCKKGKKSKKGKKVCHKRTRRHKGDGGHKRAKHSKDRNRQKRDARADGGAR